MRLCLLFSGYLLFIGSMYGQTCCSGGIPVSNNIGLENIGEGFFQLGLNYDYNNLNTLNAGTENLNDNSRRRITHSILLNTAYSISDRLSVEALFTWVNQRRIINQFGNTDLQSTNGIGDAVVLAKYGFNEVLGEGSVVTLGLGGKIPLGSYEEVNDIGITYIADLQPGSGAWDAILFGAISKRFSFRPTATFFSRVVYRATGENKDYLGGLQVYEYGNEVQVFLGVSDEFLLFNKKLVSPSVAFKYRNAKRDKIDTIELSNTGGNWLFLLPGISIDLSKRVSFLMRGEFPLISDVDGTQLTPTYRISSGFMINLNFKKRTILNLAPSSNEKK